MTADGRLAADDDKPSPAVFQRRVFYIPGYDPFPPRRYRELYRKEGAAQAALSGYHFEIAPKRGDGPYGWNVTARIEGADVTSRIEVLVWSDIVQASMGAGILATYAQLVRTAWAYIASGALFRLMRLRKGPVIAALYPVFALILQLIVAGLAGWFSGRLLSDLIGGMPGVLAGSGAGILAVFLVLRGFRALDGRVYAYYLMHDYAFTAQHGGANPATLERRIDAFRWCIAQAMGPEVDEVLIVGHSSGAHLAVSILADLLRAGSGQADGDQGARRPALSFLSLGQVVPMVSFLPRAKRLRADLAFLSTRDDLTWVDVTAPGDGCAFALCDPVAVSGVAPAGQRWPLVLSAAFTRTLTAERWKALRWRFFRLHFQYLCAFDNLAGRTDDYDYFRVTAGPMTLGERYAGRAPSKSRITRSVNRFTDIAA
jgi:hypothetical protein